MKTDPYRAILQSLRPLKEMRFQWRGFLAVCGLLLAVASYIFVRLQGQVDVIDRELRNEIQVLKLHMVELNTTCEHVSPARMLQIDIINAEQQHQIDELRKKRSGR